MILKSCGGPFSGYRNLPVIVAVSAVCVMEVPGDEVVGVIAVRDHLMAATRPMLVPCIMSGACMRRGAGVRI